MNDVGEPCAGEPHARFDRGPLATATGTTRLARNPRASAGYRPHRHQASGPPHHRPGRSRTPNHLSRGPRPSLGIRHADGPTTRISEDGRTAVARRVRDRSVAPAMPIGARREGVWRRRCGGAFGGVLPRVVRSMSGAHCDRPGRASSDACPLAPIAVVACRAAGRGVEVAPVTPLINPRAGSRIPLRVETRRQFQITS